MLLADVHLTNTMLIELRRFTTYDSRLEVTSDKRQTCYCLHCTKVFYGGPALAYIKTGHSLSMHISVSCLFSSLLEFKS